MSRIYKTTIELGANFKIAVILSGDKCCIEGPAYAQRAQKQPNGGVYIHSRLVLYHAFADFRPQYEVNAPLVLYCELQSRRIHVFG